MLKVPQKQKKDRKIILFINIFCKCLTNKIEPGSGLMLNRDDIIEKYEL